MSKNRSNYHPQVLVRRLYDWVVHWAETPYAQPALFMIAFVESAFFPIPPDVLLIAMGVSASKKSLRYALICTLGSVTGGCFGYFIGMGLWGSMSEFFFTYIPNFTPELFEKVKDLYQDNAALALFTAGFTPIPYKIFTIAAGVAHIPLLTFVGASFVGRGLRFSIVGTGLYFLGPKMKVWIEKYFDKLTIAFTLLLVTGFLILKFIFH
ncbi:MAG: cytochrome B [Bdellovibrionaceae bacterium]|nr:cytochrome B [Pseudobdellovibrionaceae bacterium]